MIIVDYVTVAGATKNERIKGEMKSMMKKLLVLTLSLATALSLAACGGSDSGSGSAAPAENVGNVAEPVDNADDAEAPVDDADDAEVPADNADDAEAPAENVDDADAESDGEFTLWDVDKETVPDMSNTTWSFAGGYVDGREMTEEEISSSLEAYGGVCQFAFDAEGGVQLVQGGGALEGTYEYWEDGVAVTFDANGTELKYACIFTDMDGITMIAISDEDGKNAMYLAQ